MSLSFKSDLGKPMSMAEVKINDFQAYILKNILLGLLLLKSTAIS